MPCLLPFAWVRRLSSLRTAPRRPERRRSRPLTLEHLEVRETPTVSPGTITTVVGNSGAPMPANPAAVAVDAAGDVFIADDQANQVYEVNHATGVVSTLAGNGSAGFSGDGGPAINAQLDGPEGLAVDAKGDLFIADQLNERIREVSTKGVITTVAGSPPQASNGGGGGFSDGLSDGWGGNGSSGGYSGDGGVAVNAQLNTPASVAVDAAGDLFIADLGNNVIRKVNTKGVISTLAGNGQQGYIGDGIPAVNAELNNPADMVVDAAGDVFIADSGNNRVREVNTHGVITTVVGNGTPGFSGDLGPAGSATLNTPSSLALNAQGTLFIADYGNNRIREVSHATGGIATVAGNGSATGDNVPAATAALNGPDELALDGAGNLFLLDAGTHRVREIAAIGAMDVVVVPDHLVVTAAKGQPAGAAFTFTVQALNASNQIDANFKGSVHFSSTDSHAQLPADVALTAGTGTFSSTLRTAGNQTLTVASSAASGGASATMNVAPAAVSQFLITLLPVPGSSVTVVMATAEDAFGNLAVNYTGAVALTSSDAKAVLPPAYHFQAADAGVHSFNVVLHTAGTQTVTVKDTHSPGVKASISVPVLAGPAVRLSVASSNSAATAGAAMTWTVTAQDAFGNTASRYQGVVQLSSSDSKAVLPGTLTFGKSDNGIKQFTVVFHTAGTQSVSVSDKTAHLSASLSAIVQAGAASKLLLTGSKAPKAGTAAVYTLTAMDAFGNVATGYRGTVRWQSTDGKASLPSAYTFSATDKGSHSFSITFVGKKSQTLSAADTVNGTISGSESGIVVM